MRNNEIEPVFSPFYSPIYNPSEYLINIVKQKARNVVLKILYFDRIEKYEIVLKRIKNEIREN